MCEYNKDIVIDILNQIKQSIDLIIERDKAKRIRDVIAHHYFDIDEEIVFLICKEKLPEMQKVINKMLNNLKL